MTSHDDTLLPLVDAVPLFPRFRSGRPPTTESVRRWVRTGRLEARRIGGIYFTTREAIDRFLRSLEKSDPVRLPPPCPPARPPHPLGSPKEESASPGGTSAPRSTESRC